LGYSFSYPPAKEKEMRTSGIGGSLFLIAVGAILYWAVTGTAEGFDIDAAGLILMVVGVVGLVLTLILTSTVHETDTHNDGVTIVER
jgi:hypothetical protein